MLRYGGDDVSLGETKWSAFAFERLRAKWRPVRLVSTVAPESGFREWLQRKEDVGLLPGTKL